ncbi:MAG: sensor histidine kinase [Longimicrobiales bacterium]
MALQIDEQRIRLLRFAAPLLLVLVLAGVLTLQALAAERSKRVTAERTLGDYANFAAFIIASAARQEVERRLLYAFGPVRALSPQTGAPLPAPLVLTRDRSETNRCVASGVHAPSYVRLDLPGQRLTVDGAPLPAAATRWLADTLALIARSSTRDGLTGQLFADQHQAGLLAYQVLRDTTGTPFAVYAKSNCLYVDKESVFAMAMARTPVLPPTLTGALPNDSLVSVRVSDAHGHLLYASPKQYASPITGEEISPQPWGQMRLTVSIRPEVAYRLVIGGYNYSRMPLAVLLLLLIVLFAGLAVVQLRRQQEVMRLRERFISGVSHELRTPLQQILVFSQLLRMGKIEASERQHSIEVVERETRRLIHLVENVLRFSRSARGHDALTIERVPLEPLIRDSVQAFELLARANQVSTTVQIEDHVQALVDGNALRRVLLNLLDNAVKYGPPGQTVTIRLAAVDQRARITIDDQGPGIPSVDRARVWEPFQRLEREAHIAGSGMGLAIVRDLIERMNGAVRIEDAPGRGTRFTVELPQHDHS